MRFPFHLHTGQQTGIITDFAGKADKNPYNANGVAGGGDEPPLLCLEVLAAF